jgi:hypothetical protein
MERMQLIKDMHHIIQPTLESEVGHYSSFVRSVCAAIVALVKIKLWARKGFSSPGLPSVIQVKRH